MKATSADGEMLTTKEVCHLQRIHPSTLYKLRGRQDSEPPSRHRVNELLGTAIATNVAFIIPWAIFQSIGWVVEGFSRRIVDGCGRPRFRLQRARCMACPRHRLCGDTELIVTTAFERTIARAIFTAD
jgi:hypothetical protein